MVLAALTQAPKIAKGIASISRSITKPSLKQQQITFRDEVVKPIIEGAITADPNLKVGSSKKIAEIIKTETGKDVELDTINNWMRKCAHVDSKIFFHNENNLIRGTFIGVNPMGEAIIKSNNKINHYSNVVLEL